MHISDGHSIARLPAGDRRQELLAVLETLVPQVAARVEGLGLYLAVAAVWGIVLYVGMGAFLAQ